MNKLNKQEVNTKKHNQAIIKQITEEMAVISFKYFYKKNSKILKKLANL